LRLRSLLALALLCSWLGTTTAAAQDVAALEARIAALEQKLAALEQEGLTVRGSFRVVNAAGATLFSVADGAGGALVAVGAEGGGSLQVGASGQPNVLVQATGSDALVAAATAGSRTRFGEEHGGVGLVIERDGRKLAELSKWHDREFVSLRIFGQSGTQVAGMGVQAGATDNGLLLVSGAGGDEALVTGEGYVGLKDDGLLKIVLSAVNLGIGLYEADGQALLTLGQGKNGGGNLTAYNAAGTVILGAGATGDGGGEVCIVRAAGKGQCMGKTP